MKIIKKVGEKLLPSWLAAELRPILVFTGAGAALMSGSVTLAIWAWRKLRERLSAWESIGALAIGAYVAAYASWHAPHIARFAVPGAVIAWCTAAWSVAPVDPAEPGDEAGRGGPAEPDPQDVEDLVRDLIGDGRGILLTGLRQPLHAADTRAVREVLATAGIKVREGVRTAGGNGPGVHRDDLPAPSPPPPTASAGGVAAGEGTNANANNKLRVESREGMTIISDPAERYRAHSLKKAP